MSHWVRLLDRLPCDWLEQMPWGAMVGHPDTGEVFYSNARARALLGMRSLQGVSPVRRKYRIACEDGTPWTREAMRLHMLTGEVARVRLTPRRGPCRWITLQYALLDVDDQCAALIKIDRANPPGARTETPLQLVLAARLKLMLHQQRHDDDGCVADVIRELEAAAGALKASRKASAGLTRPRCPIMPSSNTSDARVLGVPTQED
jgi:hypothetical protein